MEIFSYCNVKKKTGGGVINTYWIVLIAIFCFFPWNWKQSDSEKAVDETERSHFTHARTLTPHIHALSEWHKWGSRNSAVILEHFVIKNYLYYIHTLLSHHLRTPVIKQHLFYSRQRMWWLPCLLAIPYGAMLLARASYLTLLLNLQAGRRMLALWFVSTEKKFSLKLTTVSSSVRFNYVLVPLCLCTPAFKMLVFYSKMCSFKWRCDF